MHPARRPHRSPSPRTAQHPAYLKLQAGHEATERPRHPLCIPRSGSRARRRSHARCRWTRRRCVTGPTAVRQSSRSRRLAAGRARVNRGSATVSATHQNYPSAYPPTIPPPPPPKSSARHSETNSPLFLVRRCRRCRPSERARRRAQPSHIGDLTLTGSGG